MRTRGVVGDLTNFRQGMLTILEKIPHHNGNSWLCKCDCGKILKIRESVLISKPRTSCGCNSYKKKTRIKLIIGQKFGKLLVIEETKEVTSRGSRTVYKLECECGKIVYRAAYTVLSNNTQGCNSCSAKINNKNANRGAYGQSARNSIINTYKYNAKRRGLSFELTHEQCHNLFQGKCHYCGIKPSRIRHYKGQYGEYIYNGIDRKDNSDGYNINNCVSCCTRCNIIKRDCSYKDFINFIQDVIHENNNSG